MVTVDSMEVVVVEEEGTYVAAVGCTYPAWGDIPLWRSDFLVENPTGDPCRSSTLPPCDFATRERDDGRWLELVKAENAGVGIEI